MNNKTTTQNLIKDANESLLFTTNRPDIVMEKGKGMYLWDVDGNAYLDFIGGWAVTCLGHSNEVITNTIQKQAETLINASPAFYNTQMIKLSKLLTDNSCFDKVFFGSSGSEANEGAIKLARKYGSKYLNGAYEIITTGNSFHGRTLATMSATGKDHWKTLFEPKVSGFKHVVFNDIQAIYSNVNDNTCAIMIELVQGEGGVYAADKIYVEALRKICDEKGILLIFDEIQTGIGRIGTLFGYEEYGIEPDVMTLAKGLGGGFPVSALLTKDKYNIFEPGDQGGTYTGQPLAMAVGYAVVNEVINKKIYENAKLQGEYLKEKLNSIKEIFNLKNIRGKGLLIGFDLPKDVGNEIVNECLKEGLIINAPKPYIVRFIPALIVTNKDIDAMMNIFVKVLKKIGMAEE